MAGFVRRHPALALFLVAVLLGPGLVAPVLLGVLPPGFAQLGALSASAAGFILAWTEGGRAGAAELLRRGARWRVGARWWLVALLLPVVPAAIAIAVNVSKGGPGTPASAWYSFPPLLLFQVVFAGVGEEFGWRGFALPRLQQWHGAVAASLIVGSFHAVWHLPLFFLPEQPYAAYAADIGLIPAFLGYAALVLALSVLLTWMFNGSGGSVLLAAVFHGSFNAWNNFLPIEGGGMPGLVRYVIVVALLAAIVAVGWMRRRPLAEAAPT